MRSTGAGHSPAPVKVAGSQRRQGCAAVAEETASSPRAEEQTKKRRHGAVGTPDEATASSTSSNCSTFIRPKKNFRFRQMSEGARRMLLSMLREEEEMYNAVVDAVWEQVQEESQPTVPRRSMNASEHTGEVSSTPTPSLEFPDDNGYVEIVQLLLNATHSEEQKAFLLISNRSLLNSHIREQK